RRSRSSPRRRQRCGNGSTTPTSCAWPARGSCSRASTYCSPYPPIPASAILTRPFVLLTRAPWLERERSALGPALSCDSGGAVLGGVGAADHPFFELGGGGVEGRRRRSGPADRIERLDQPHNAVVEQDIRLFLLVTGSTPPVRPARCRTQVGDLHEAVV